MITLFTSDFLSCPRHGRPQIVEGPAIPMEIGRAPSTWILPVRAHGRNNPVPSLHAWWFHTQDPGTTLGNPTLIISTRSNDSLQRTATEKFCARTAGNTMPCCACCKVMVLPHFRCSQPRPVPFFSRFFPSRPPIRLFLTPRRNTTEV